MQYPLLLDFKSSTSHSLTSSNLYNQLHAEAGASLPTAETTWSVSSCENKHPSNTKISLKTHDLGTASCEKTHNGVTAFPLTSFIYEAHFKQRDNSKYFPRKAFITVRVYQVTNAAQCNAMKDFPTQLSFYYMSANLFKFFAGGSERVVVLGERLRQ